MDSLKVLVLGNLGVSSGPGWRSLRIGLSISYLLMEFVLAHELAHVLAGDTEGTGTKGGDAEEAGAHHIALALLDLTTSSRQFACDPSLLEPVTQSALCLTLFEFFARCRVVLADMVAGRDSAIGNEAFLAVELNRLRLASALLDERLGHLESNGTLRSVPGIPREWRRLHL